MPCPLPAGIFGPGMCMFSEGKWGPPCGAGGRLFVTDGLWDLSYGPEDFVLLDGNLLHGVTGLRDCPGGGQSKRPELERFSAIAFSTFKRQEGMWKHGNYKGMWEESHMASVQWK